MKKLFAACLACACLVLTSIGGAAAPSLQPSQASFTQGRTVAGQTLAELEAEGGTLAGKDAPHLIAEGDSWFSYPGLDVLSALKGKLADGVRYRVYSAASAGDTVEAMAYDREQIEDFAAEFVKVRDAGTGAQVRAILLSGGGNDLAGREFHMLLNHASSVQGPLSPLDSAMADALIDRIGRTLESLIGTSAQFSEQLLGRKDVPILVHGYAPPVPDGRPFLTGWPLPGPWLEPGFSVKGYVGEATQAADLKRNTAVMATLIQRFNARVSKIPSALANVADVRYVDLTVAKVLGNELQNNAYRDNWSNELHPRDRAFIRIAEEFHKKILKK